MKKLNLNQNYAFFNKAQKITSILLIFVSIMFIANSCTKENELSNLDQKIDMRGSNNLLNPDSTYIHNGLDFELGSQITESDNTSIIYGYNSNNYVFDNDSLLRSWTFGSSDRTRTREVLDSINYLKTFENVDGGEDLVQESLIPRGWLYRDLNKQGPAWPITGFSYGNHNNTASSFLLVMTGAVICDKKWWGGKKVWILGAPGIWGNLNGPEIYFNDMAESGFDL